MGWQYINSKLVQDAFDSQGFLVGTGNEKGYYCFYYSPYVDQSIGPFISDSYLPHLEIDGVFYTLRGVTYGPVTGSGSEGRVWSSDDPRAGALYVFNSRGNGWIKFDYLKEPQYSLDIDEETMVGDRFYGGSFPQLNASAPTEWKLQGAVNDDPNNPGQDTSGDPASVSVSFKQNLWTWNSNGDWNKTKSDLCGKYYNEKDGTWKLVGMPAYAATDTSQTSPFNGEMFLRSEERDYDGKLMYEGNKGHLIRYNKTKKMWVVGTIGQGHWAESVDAPSINSPATFTGKQIVVLEGEENGHEEEDLDWSFTLTWKHMEPGNSKGTVYMGEVSLWR